MSDPAHRAALAALAPLLSVAGAATGAFVADAMALTSADARFVAVTLGMAVPLAVVRGLRPGATTRARLVLAALALPWLLAPLAPRSPLLLSWLSGGALALGADATAYAARSAWRLGARRSTRALLALLVVAPPLYLLAAAFVVLFNTQLLLAPIRLGHLAPIRDAGERALTLHTDDGYALDATYTPASRGAPGVVLVHGVADGQSRMAPLARRLQDEGYHVLRFDVRANGRSDGAVCTYGQRERADVIAAVDALRARGAGRVAVLGASMGGGVALAASARVDAAALVLLAPASSFPPLVRQRVAFLGPLMPAVLNGSARLARAMGQLPMTDWSPADHLPDDVPVLVLHGRDDGAIPLSLSERFARGRPNVELTLLDGVGHDDIPHAVTRGPAWARLADFLRARLHPSEP